MAAEGDNVHLPQEGDVLTMSGLNATLESLKDSFTESLADFFRAYKTEADKTLVALNTRIEQVAATTASGTIESEQQKQPAPTLSEEFGPSGQLATAGLSGSAAEGGGLIGFLVKTSQNQNIKLALLLLIIRI